MVRLFQSPTADDVAEGHSLVGKNVIVTGSSAGIGVELARVYCKLGARVIMPNRSIEKAENVANYIRESVKDIKLAGTVEVMKLDLMDFDSVKQFAEEFKALNIPLHYLVLNAGIMTPPLRYTKQGYESQIGTNHFSHFLLTRLLTDKMKEAGEGRLVVTSSYAHTFAAEWDWPSDGRKGFTSDEDANYKKWTCYGQSKLGNLLMAKEFSERMKQDGFPHIVGFSAHPGGVKTELGRDVHPFIVGVAKMFSFVLKSPNQGAASIMEATLSTQALEHPGAYFSPTLQWPKIVKTSKMSHNLEEQKRLWEESEKIVAKWL